MTPVENWRTRVLYWFLLLLASMCAYACTPATYSEEKTERGRVEQVLFVPEGHEEYSGYSTAGKGGFEWGTNTIPARYGVVFSCEHGTFAIDGDAAAELFRKVKVGDSVTIVYREVYDGADGTLLDFRFVDAQTRGR